MADLHWTEAEPHRAGVRRQYECSTPQGRLTLELRDAQSWLWIHRDDGDDVRVLAFDETDFDAIAARLAGLDQPPALDNYLMLMAELGVALVAHEQFEG